MDIVERLREIGWTLVIGKIQTDRRDAADEIERLREALKETEWQLKNELYDVAYDTVIYTLWPNLKQKKEK